MLPNAAAHALVHFILSATDSGTSVTAFSGDRRLGELHDVVRLSDDATAVKLARKATVSRDGKGREQ
ncbi:UNVERIFIED_ORG: hypothetical protein J2X79_001876 [Arthrobacter globiformis]|nr:hypothetical protein [Arthrobacter globiformis]